MEGAQAQLVDELQGVPDIGEDSAGRRRQVPGFNRVEVERIQGAVKEVQAQMQDAAALS